MAFSALIISVLTPSALNLLALNLVALKERNDPVTLFFVCLIGFGAGIAFFIRGFKLLQRRRLILDTPASKIRSAAMGMVEISGLAVGPYTMMAPITARPCYHYRTLIWELKQRGKNKEWVKVASECMHVPFYVDDNTGRMLVDPRGADLELHRDFQQEFCDSFFTTKEPAPPNVVGFLSRHGIVTNNKIKVEEFCIKPKNSLFILGTLAENPGLAVTPSPVEDHDFSKGVIGLSGGAFSLTADSRIDLNSASFDQRFASRVEDATPQVVRLSNDAGPATALDMTQQQRVAAALLKAGISNPLAWSAAGVSPSSGPVVQVDEDAVDAGNGSGASALDSGSDANSNGFDLHPPVVLMRGANNKAFLISWRSQREVAQTMGWQCTLMIWGGPAVALACLALFLNSVHLL